MKRVLVIACGNPLRSDDGVGWRVVEALQDATPSSVVAKAVQQLTPELAEEVSQAERVIFVDAAAIDHARQGPVYVRRIHGLPVTARLTHSLRPQTLLGLARELYACGPSEAFLVTVRAHRLELSERLSRQAERSLGDAITAVRALLFGAAQS
jgi:hydrogenase maturation protease